MVLHGYSVLPHIRSIFSHLLPRSNGACSIEDGRQRPTTVDLPQQHRGPNHAGCLGGGVKNGKPDAIHTVPEGNPGMLSSVLFVWPQICTNQKNALYICTNIHDITLTLTFTFTLNYIPFHSIPLHHITLHTYTHLHRHTPTHNDRHMFTDNVSSK